MNDAIRRIAIIGGDEHVWSAAARLLVGLRGQGVEIVVVDDSHDELNGVLSLDASAHAFHRKIGIQEPSLIGQMNGVYSYGVKLEHPSGGFTFTFSPSGDLIDRVQFHHYAARYKNLGGEVNICDYNLAAIAVDRKKFAHPKPDSPLARLDYSVNVDRDKYVSLLRAAVLQHDVRHICEQVLSVERSDGLTRALKLSNSETVFADFVIDCSGRSDPNGWESWKPYYEYDRQLSWTQRSEDTPSVACLNRQFEFASLKKSSSSMHDHYCLSFNSDELTDQQLAVLAIECDANFDLSEARIVSRPARVRTHFWDANTLYLGEAAGHIGNQIFSGLIHTHNALERWMELYPRQGKSTLSAVHYNSATRIEYERVRDAHLLALMPNNQSLNTAPERVPETLMHRASLFSGIGRVAFYESDVLEPHQWVNLFLGLNYWPKQVDPLVNHIEKSGLKKILSASASQSEKLVLEFPQHDQLLNAIRRVS